MYKCGKPASQDFNILQVWHYPPHRIYAQKEAQSISFSASIDKI